MAKTLDSIEYYPPNKTRSGHRVVHNFERAPAKRGADIYMDRPKSEEHNFGAGQEKELLAHLQGAIKGASAEPAAAEGSE